jgi:hypothetical protein
MQFEIGFSLPIRVDQPNQAPFGGLPHLHAFTPLRGNGSIGAVEAMPIPPAEIPIEPRSGDWKGFDQ